MLDSAQLIEFINPPGRGHEVMAAIPHPMHLRRESFPGWEADHAELAIRFVDEDLKDTVLVLLCQRVTILKPFENFIGLFLYHCRNLEHEDRGPDTPRANSKPLIRFTTRTRSAVNVFNSRDP